MELGGLQPYGLRKPLQRTRDGGGEGLRELGPGSQAQRVTEVERGAVRPASCSSWERTRPCDILVLGGTTGRRGRRGGQGLPFHVVQGRDTRERGGGAERHGARGEAWGAHTLRVSAHAAALPSVEGPPCRGRAVSGDRPSAVTGAAAPRGTGTASLRAVTVLSDRRPQGG